MSQEDLERMVIKTICKIVNSKNFDLEDEEESVEEDEGDEEYLPSEKEESSESEMELEDSEDDFY